MKFIFEPWMYWTIGIFIYFIGAIICAAIMGDEYDDTNTELGLKGIIWPLFLCTLILFIPFWVIGKLASLMQRKWL